MTKVDTVHLSLGGTPHEGMAFLFSGRPVTATYMRGNSVVGSETVPAPAALSLCDPWFDGDELPTELEYQFVTADWPVDFGRAKKLESRMRKALEQMPAKTGETA